MNRQEFEDALKTLGWSKAHLCSRLGLHKNTATRWKDGPPEYVSEYLQVMLLLKKALDG